MASPDFLLCPMPVSMLSLGESQLGAELWLKAEKDFQSMRVNPHCMLSQDRGLGHQSLGAASQGNLWPGNHL